MQMVFVDEIPHTANPQNGLRERFADFRFGK